MGTLMRRRRLRERHESALLSGAGTTNRPPVGYAKHRKPKPLGGVASTSYRAPWGHGIHPAEWMGKVVLRYLDDVNDPVVKALRALLLELLGDATRITAEGMATLQMICREAGVNFSNAVLFCVLYCNCGLVACLTSGQISLVS